MKSNCLSLFDDLSQDVSQIWQVHWSCTSLITWHRHLCGQGLSTWFTCSLFSVWNYKLEWIEVSCAPSLSLWWFCSARMLDTRLFCPSPPCASSERSLRVKHRFKVPGPTASFGMRKAPKLFWWASWVRPTHTLRAIAMQVSVLPATPPFFLPLYWSRIAVGFVQDLSSTVIADLNRVYLHMPPPFFSILIQYVWLFASLSSSSSSSAVSASFASFAFTST